MSKNMNLAFDPVGIWDRDDFRSIIKEFVLNTEVDVYLVTTSTDIAFINNVIRESGMKAANSYMVADKDAILTKMDAILIDIYMTASNQNMLFIDAMAETATCVLVNNIVDNYKNQMKYITKLEFWINQWAKNNGEKETC